MQTEKSDPMATSLSLTLTYSFHFTLVIFTHWNVGTFQRKEQAHVKPSSPDSNATRLGCHVGYQTFFARQRRANICPLVPCSRSVDTEGKWSSSNLHEQTLLKHSYLARRQRLSLQPEKRACAASRSFCDDGRRDWASGICFRLDQLQGKSKYWLLQHLCKMEAILIARFNLLSITRAAREKQAKLKRLHRNINTGVELNELHLLLHT